MTGFYIALVFFVTGLVMVSVTLLISRIIQPRKSYPQKYLTYECGELPQGDAWIRFNNRFYIIALIFIIFDVEIIFMYPWAVVFDQLKMVAFIEMFIFISILLVGLAYVWAKGDLRWVKPRPKFEHLPKAKGK